MGLCIRPIQDRRSIGRTLSWKNIYHLGFGSKTTDLVTTGQTKISATQLTINRRQMYQLHYRSGEVHFSQPPWIFQCCDFTSFYSASYSCIWCRQWNRPSCCGPASTASIYALLKPQLLNNISLRHLTVIFGKFSPDERTINKWKPFRLYLIDIWARPKPQLDTSPTGCNRSRSCFLALYSGFRLVNCLSKSPAWWESGKFVISHWR